MNPKPSVDRLPSEAVSANSTPVHGETGLRLLHVTGSRSPAGWLAVALSSTTMGRVQVHEVTSLGDGLQWLRAHPADAVLIDLSCGSFDPPSSIEAFRTGTHDRLPVMVIGDEMLTGAAEQCLRSGADAFLPLQSTSAYELAWHLRRSVERHHLMDAHDRLQQHQRRRLNHERDEVLRLLAEQTSLTAQDEALLRQSASAAQMIRQLREVLQAYVVMGHGHLTEELDQLASELREQGFCTRETLVLYGCAVRELVAELGSRSARHVYDRSNLVLVDLLLRQAERSLEVTK